MQSGERELIHPSLRHGQHVVCQVIGCRRSVSGQMRSNGNAWIATAGYQIQHIHAGDNGGVFNQCPVKRIIT